MNDQTKGASEPWSKIRTWIVGLTAIVVVLPALINGGIDVYKSILNIPRTDAERTNSELFEKHFNKPPVAVLPVSVKTDLGTVDMKLSIYDEGDIYVEYGTHTRWFASPVQKTASLSLISSAYAQGSAGQSKTGEYRQVDKLMGNKIVRERYYSDGTKETYVIDRNTGAIQSRIVTRDSKAPPAELTLAERKVRQLPGLDVDARKQK
jgi:hypothetical protein